MRSNDRSEYIKSAVKLKQQEEIIEKTVDNFVNCMKLEPDILRVLQDERYLCTSNRRKLSNSLRDTVLEIANELITIKKYVVTNLQERRKIDVDSFKKKCITLADKLREFKNNCCLEDLTREETELDQYLHGFSLTLNKYEVRKSSSSSVTDVGESSKRKCNSCEDFQDYKDTRDFTALVAKTGHTQTWTEEDHLFFLKVRKTSRNIASMVAEIRKKCPDLSVERIVNHEAWYKIYLDLREKQRNTIREWRRKKELERRYKANSANVVSDKTTHSDTSDTNLGNEDITKKSDPAENTSTCTAKLSASRGSSTNRTKEIITRWRTDKENARAQENERAKSESESRRIRKDNRRLARASQLKAAISAFKEKNMENFMSSSTISITDSDRMNTKSGSIKLIKSFRCQDEKFLNRRKAMLASKRSNSDVQMRQKKQARPDGHSTLFKPTKVWLQKCRQYDDHLELHQQLLFVKDIPKLATYNWRNQESS